MVAKRTIGRTLRDGTFSPLFARWTLFECRWFAILVHRFVRADADEDPHDHPWWYVTIPLRSYWEWTWRLDGYNDARNPATMTRRKVWALWPSFRPARHAHQVDSLVGPRDSTRLITSTRPMWSLVIRGPYCRTWGFVTLYGWAAWYDYLYASRQITRDEWRCEAAKDRWARNLRRFPK